MKKSGNLFTVLPVISLFIFCGAVSCTTMGAQEKKLAVRRSAGEVRFDDIIKQVSENPVAAIDLIGEYRLSYKVSGGSEEEKKLEDFEKEARGNLRKLLEQAVFEERWDDAVSYSRSLALYEIVASSASPAESASLDFDETEYLLSGAKKKMKDGNNLGAFLAAARVHQIRPLSFEDALLFLERAVELKQLRTAAFFLAASESAVASAQVNTAGAAAIPACIHTC